MVSINKIIFKIFLVINIVLHIIFFNFISNIFYLIHHPNIISTNYIKRNDIYRKFSEYQFSISNDYSLSNPSGVKTELGYQKGNRKSIFNFYVTYKDLSNKSPQYVYVEVNGKNHTMLEKYDWDYDYTDGVLYEFNATADELGLDRLGYYDYCFYAFNGTVLERLPTSKDVYFDFELVNAPPELYPIENMCEPKVGYFYTEFVFRVNYTDIDNDTPKYIYVQFINLDVKIKMERENPLDKNNIDGVIYIGKIRGLPVGGVYQYYYIVSDGFNSEIFLYNGTKPFIGPYVEIDIQFTFLLILNLIILGMCYTLIVIYYVNRLIKKFFKNKLK